MLRNIELGALALACAFWFSGAVAKAQEFAPGLALDEKTESHLGQTLQKLVDLLKPAEPDLAALLKETAAARKDAERLVGLADSQQKPREPDAVTVPAKSPVVLAGSAKADEVRRLWAEQLQMNIRAAHGLLTGDHATVGEWVGWPDYSKQQNRARPLAEALREAERCLLLLTRPSEAFGVKKGDALFSDDFAKGADNWEMFGQCVARNDGDAFRLVDEKPAHPDAMMWTKKDFDGDFLVEFTFNPHSKGARPGALFAICGRPRPGKDYSVCVGDSMDTYNKGIDAYHFSMHRGNTGLGNVRRVGPGLKMLASGKDPCPEVGKAYEVAIGKAGPVIFLLVDGKLIHNYVDAGTFGAVLAAGRIGIRHWAGMDGSYKSFRVSRLVRAEGKE